MKLSGFEAWMPLKSRTTEISYCYNCDEIYVSGFFKGHYCEGDMTLGYLEETYVEQLERELGEARYQLELMENL